MNATWTDIKKWISISEGYGCGTHIKVSQDPAWELEEIRRIALAVIHFETAFEALLPKSQVSDLHMKSNWLDSQPLGLSGLTRRESIAKIGSPSLTTTIKQVVDLVNGDEQEETKRHFAWNFCNLLGKTGTIEFRKAPQCTKAEGVLAWAELTLSFIQAAIGCESIERLLQVPSTVGGLLWFVKQFPVAGSTILRD